MEVLYRLLLVVKCGRVDEPRHTDYIASITGLGGHGVMYGVCPAGECIPRKVANA